MFSSDHFIVNFTIDMKVKSLPQQSANVFNFKSANWERINEKIRTENLSKCVRDCENDVNLASASNAIIVGFHVRPTAKAQALADQEKGVGWIGVLPQN